MFCPHVTAPVSLVKPFSVLLGGVDTLTCNFLSASCPEHHASVALGTPSVGNVIAQVSWEHTTPCTRVDDCLNLLDDLNWMRLFQWCRSSTNYSSQSRLYSIRHDVRNFQVPNMLSNRHDARLECSIFSMLYSTRHDVDDECHLHVSTRRILRNNSQTGDLSMTV